MVAGDTISGEASLGTLRYLLTRPAGRTRLLGVKSVATLVYCLAAALAVTVGGLLAGVSLFPHGKVISLSGTTLSLPAGIERTLLAALIVGVSLLGLAAIGIFVSTVTDVPVAAMAVTAGIAVMSLVLDSIPQLAVLHPWLFTHQELAFGDLLRTPIQWGNIGSDIFLQAGYVAVFGLAAWARFTTRDIEA